MGSAQIKKINFNKYSFNENIKTNLNGKTFIGFQIFKIIENKKKFFFYFDTGRDKNKLYQEFKKKMPAPSIYFCNKDIYTMNICLLSKNYFLIHTKIKGPNKKFNIIAKYFRTI